MKRCLLFSIKNVVVVVVVIVSSCCLVKRCLLLTLKIVNTRGC